MEKGTGRSDDIILRVEPLPGGADDTPRAGAALAQLIKSQVGVTVRIALGDVGSVARSQGKAVRVVVKRPKE